MTNSGQVSDPGPLLEGCDPETCTDRVGGEHSDKCVRCDCGKGEWCPQFGSAFAAAADAALAKAIAPASELENRALWGDR